MLFINGEWRDAASGATFESQNPAPVVVGTVADAGVADVGRRSPPPTPRSSGRPAPPTAVGVPAGHQLILERARLAKLMTESRASRSAALTRSGTADFLLWFAEG
jgi:succinate-semialdehyde dehydrogenase/glutarate-semialdehyde dehydrogenase